MTKRSVLLLGLVCAAACGDASSDKAEDAMDGGIGREAGSADPDAGPLDMLDGRVDLDAMTEADAGMDSGGEGDGAAMPDAGELDAGDELDSAAEPDTGIDPNAPVPDMENTGFLAYGQLRLAFEAPITANELNVTVSPNRPVGLEATGITQDGANAVIVSLNNYHLPVDYAVTVSGSDYTVDIAIPGQGNGSRTAFASRRKGTGDLRTWMPETENAASGREAGDIICQAEADAAGLKGTFRAFLSSNEVGDAYDAACRALNGTGQWVDHCGRAAEPTDSAPFLDQDGLPIVYGARGMARGEWLVPFRYHADGELSSGNNHAWTGSSYDARAKGGSCKGFTSANSEDRSWASARGSEYLFNEQYSLPCDGSSAQSVLLCVQTGTGFFPASTLHQRTGKAVFITSGSFLPASSESILEEADTFCQEAANAAGYATHENFVAWMSDSNEHAPCRLVASGGVQGADKCGLGSWPSTRWVRPDGLVIADGVAELLSGRIRAPILFTPDGARGGSSELVMTNTKNDGFPAATSCASGHVGSVAAWSSYVGTCTSRPLICFER